MTGAIKAKIKALAYGGSCIGEIVEGDAELLGKKIFVRSCIPGELVTIAAATDKKSYLEGELETVITPSPQRIEPPCPYFNLCGGCDLEHIDLDYQRHLKADMIRTMLARQAGIDIDVTVTDNDLPGYSYRNRIALHLDQAGKLGFYKSGTGSVVDIEKCLLVEKQLNQKLFQVRKYAEALAPCLAGVVLELSGNSVVIIFKLREKVDLPQGLQPLDELSFLKPIFPHFEIHQRGKIIYGQTDFKKSNNRAAVGHFSQVNNAGNKILIRTVRKHCSSKTMTELYAGSGNFTIPLALAGKSIDAVEISTALTKQGQLIAQQNSLSKKISYFNLSAEKFLKTNNLKETLLLDPPRSGAKNVIRHCHPKQTKEIVYVSCNLPTLQRDLKALVSRGYHLEQLYLIDMFPQTHHAETVSCLRSSL